MTFSTGTLLSVLAAASWGDLLSLLVRATLITAIGTCVCALLRNASAAIRHLTAMTTLTALIVLPIAWAILPALSLPILPVRAASVSAVEDPVPAGGTVGGSGAVLSEESYAGSVGELPPSATPALSRSRALELALPIALIVTVGLLLHLLFSVVAAWITVRRARPIDDADLRRDLDEARERLGVSRAVDLRESGSIGIPVVWGFFRPALLLPLGARGWTREQLRVVFLHEVAHVARHDGVGLLLARIATSLFWFHPLVWILARTARRECERCCDDLVLAAGERPTDYAERLLAIVRSMTRSDPFAGVAPALAQRSNFESRLISILRSDQRRGAITRAGLAATVGSAAVLLVATAVVHVVAAEPGRLVDPSKMTSSEESGDEGLAVSGIQVRVPTALPSPEETKKGERWFRSGEEAFDEGSYVRAASSYLTAAANGHRFPEALYRAAGALAKAGSNDDAMRTLEAAIEAGYDGTKMASDPSFEGLRDDPRFTALQCPQAAPSPPAVQVVVPYTYQVVGTPKKFADVFNQSGITLMRAGQYERAIEAFEEEVRESGSSNAMYNIACAYSLKGDKRRAFDALERAIENGFDNSQHMMQDEDLRLLQGDPHFYQLVRLSKDLQLSGGGRFGNGMRDEEDWQKSLPRFERVTREHPKLGRAWSNLGYARLESGDPRGGAAAYQRALDLGYQRPTILYNLACCAARSGDRDQAFAWLDRAEKAGFELGEHVGTDSDLDAIREDPRYEAMLEQWDQKMAKEHRENHKDHKDHEVEKTY